MRGQTLYAKIWQDHVVEQRADGSCLLYIDRHLIHEVTSPQAFSALDAKNRHPWRRDSVFAVADHMIPSDPKANRQHDPLSRLQVQTLEKNCQRHRLSLLDVDDPRQGIVHIIGPEQGLTLPGMTLVCGDSHTSTHGALGALAFGIGTSEVEHVLATQCLLQQPSRCLRINATGQLAEGVYAKDLILSIIARIGTAGGTGYVIEYAGEAISALSIEARMTMCNMSIEAGARAGLIAVDQKTLDYLRGRPYAPSAALWPQAETAWRTLHSDPDAVFDHEITVAADHCSPQISWGTSPEMVVGVDECVPAPADSDNAIRQQEMRHALTYMGLQPQQRMTDISLDQVFIGSCTNSRIEDLRIAAEVIKRMGGRKAARIKRAMVVPGSGLIRRQAEAEGLDECFLAAGFEWRQPACSMCIALNADRLQAEERCASTSNRNFEGRQGAGGRTHLVSPASAAAAAMAGHFVDVRSILSP